VQRLPPLCVVPIKLQIGASARKVLLPHYAPFGLPDVERRTGSKYFGGTINST
jgi:hypothetical protein